MVCNVPQIVWNVNYHGKKSMFCTIYPWSAIEKLEQNAKVDECVHLGYTVYKNNILHKEWSVEHEHPKQQGLPTDKRDDFLHGIATRR